MKIATLFWTNESKSLQNKIAFNQNQHKKYHKIIIQKFEAFRIFFGENLQ